MIKTASVLLKTASGIQFTFQNSIIKTTAIEIFDVKGVMFTFQNSMIKTNTYIRKISAKKLVYIPK